MATTANRDAMLAKLDELELLLDEIRAGGGERYVQLHRDRGKLLARERIELLLDRDAPFLELSPLAAWGTEYTVGAAIVTGIGVVEGVECMIIANDPTVRGGTSNPFTVRKVLRAIEIARENRLPLINLVESGGADLPARRRCSSRAARFPRHDAALGGRDPHDRARLRQLHRGRRLHPGHVSDYIVLVKERAKVFLGGPPLVKMATGEESDDEELGGAEMHARTSGLADYLADDEPGASGSAAQIVAS